MIIQKATRDRISRAVVKMYNCRTGELTDVEYNEAWALIQALGEMDPIRHTRSVD